MTSRRPPTARILPLSTVALAATAVAGALLLVSTGLAHAEQERSAR